MNKKKSRDKYKNYTKNIDIGEYKLLYTMRNFTVFLKVRNTK